MRAATVVTFGDTGRNSRTSGGIGGIAQGDDATGIVVDDGAVSGRSKALGRVVWIGVNERHCVGEAARHERELFVELVESVGRHANANLACRRASGNSHSHVAGNGVIGIRYTIATVGGRAIGLTQIERRIGESHRTRAGAAQSDGEHQFVTGGQCAGIALVDACITDVNFGRAVVVHNGEVRDGVAVFKVEVGRYVRRSRRRQLDGEAFIAFGDTVVIDLEGHRNGLLATGSESRPSANALIIGVVSRGSIDKCVVNGNIGLRRRKQEQGELLSAIAFDVASLGGSDAHLRHGLVIFDGDLSRRLQAQRCSVRIAQTHREVFIALAHSIVDDFDRNRQSSRRLSRGRWHRKSHAASFGKVVTVARFLRSSRQRSEVNGYGTKLRAVGHELDHNINHAARDVLSHVHLLIDNADNASGIIVNDGATAGDVGRVVIELGVGRIEQANEEDLVQFVDCVRCDGHIERGLRLAGRENQTPRSRGVIDTRRRTRILSHVIRIRLSRRQSLIVNRRLLAQHFGQVNGESHVIETARAFDNTRILNGENRSGVAIARIVDGARRGAADASRSQRARSISNDQAKCFGLLDDIVVDGGNHQTEATQALGNGESAALRIGIIRAGWWNRAGASRGDVLKRVTKNNVVASVNLCALTIDQGKGEGDGQALFGSRFRRVDVIGGQIVFENSSRHGAGSRAGQQRRILDAKREGFVVLVKIVAKNQNGILELLGASGHRDGVGRAARKINVASRSALRRGCAIGCGKRQTDRGVRRFR